jgi:hypothetical protein
MSESFGGRGRGGWGGEGRFHGLALSEEGPKGQI